MMVRWLLSATLVLMSFAFGSAFAERSNDGLGIPVSDAEAKTVVGGCVVYISVTSCTLDSRCRVISCENSSTTSGNDQFSDSFSCGTYLGKSCGVYATSKPCSGG